MPSFILCIFAELPGRDAINTTHTRHDNKQHALLQRDDGHSSRPSPVRRIHVAGGRDSADASVLQLGAPARRGDLRRRAGRTGSSTASQQQEVQP